MAHPVWAGPASEGEKEATAEEEFGVLGGQELEFGVQGNTFLEEMASEPCAKLKAFLCSPNPTCSHTSGLEEAPGPLFLGLAFLRKDFEGFLRKSN